MEYYIDPSWFYWVDVIGALRSFFVFILIFSGIFAVFAFLIYDEAIIEKKTFKKIEIITVVFFIFSLFVIIFIPSKEVLIEIEVAKLAAENNLKLTADSIKDIINYIAETIN